MSSSKFFFLADQKTKIGNKCGTLYSGAGYVALWVSCYETWKSWRSHGPLQALLFVGQIHPKADQGRGKQVMGSPSSKPSSSDRKTTATNGMHINDLEACEQTNCYFWFHSEVKIVKRFYVFLDLVILAYFIKKI